MRERPDPRCGEIGAPVTQEHELVRSRRRPVPEVEAEEREAVAECVAQLDRVFARGGPDARVGHAVAGTEHRQTVTAASPRLRRREARAAALELSLPFEGLLFDLDFELGLDTVDRDSLAADHVPA